MNAIPAGDELLPLIHPGEILLEDFLKPLGLSQDRMAQDLGVPPRRINEIVHGKRAVTALRLGRYFGLEPAFWLRLQASYDLRAAERHHGERINNEVHPRPTNPPTL